MWSAHTLEPTYAIPEAQSFTGLAHQELHDGRRPSSVSSAIIARSFDHFHSPFQQHPEPTIHPSYWAEATPEFEDGPFFCVQNDDIFCYQQAQTLQHRLAPAQDMCTSYDMATDFEADDHYAQSHLSAEPTASCAAYQQLIPPPLPPRTECIVRDPFLPLRNFDMLGPHSDSYLDRRKGQRQSCSSWPCNLATCFRGSTSVVFSWPCNLVTLAKQIAKPSQLTLTCADLENPSLATQVFGN